MLLANLKWVYTIVNFFSLWSEKLLIQTNKKKKKKKSINNTRQTKAQTEFDERNIERIWTLMKSNIFGNYVVGT